ncbi:MAG: hypothetical protein FWH18_05350 [Marinilabiliaceae bacterium]|nr:hypothetical protein [Marinilabiliaceae bacterium]
MHAYQIDTSVSDRGVIELLGMPYLYNKKVKLIVIPEERTTTLEQRRQAAERIMKRQETIPLRHYSDEELDNMRYEYLKEKHQ